MVHAISHHKPVISTLYTGLCLTYGSVLYFDQTYIISLEAFLSFNTRVRENVTG